MLGPVALFGTRFQPNYVYSVVGDEKIKKRKAVIIEAVPRPGAPETTSLYGKAWLDAETADIIKIEWNEECVVGRNVVEERGRKFKRKPRIRLCSEFKVEKNGLRFPSRLYIEEAYVRSSGRGRAFIRSKTTVTYEDFKFFTVEVEIK